MTYKETLLVQTIRELRADAIEKRDLAMMQIASLLLSYQKTKSEKIAAAIQKHECAAKAADWICHYAPIAEMRYSLGHY